MSGKELPDVPALVEEAREWAGSYASWGDNGLVDRLVDRLADALETMHDLYLQADTSAVNLIAEKDELQARIRAAKETWGQPLRRSRSALR